MRQVDLAGAADLELVSGVVHLHPQDVMVEAAPAPTHGWSNAKSSNGQPNAPTTRGGRNRPTAHISLFNYLTERYCG